MKENEIIRNLLIDFKILKPDLEKFNGNLAPALAERLIKFINDLTPHAHLFDDSFKIAIKKYIITYEDVCKGQKEGEEIFKLIKPTSELIEKTLVKKSK